MLDINAFLDEIEPRVHEDPAPTIDSTVAKFKSLVLSRGLGSLRRILATFDREKSGTVSIQQLGSAFSQLRIEISPSELLALCQSSGNNRYVDWNDLCQLLDPSDNDSETSNQSWWENKPSRDMTFALQKIWKAAEAHGIDLLFEMTSGDVMKSGFICRNLFRKTLNLVPSRISDADFSLIARRYSKQETDLISYRDFCNDLEEFGKDLSDESSSVEFCRKPKNLQNSIKALRLFKAALSFVQMQPCNLFNDLDKNKLGTIAVTLLEKAFQPLRDLVDEQTLLQVEEDFRDVRQPEKFNYRRFCVALGYLKCEKSDMEEIRRNSNATLAKKTDVIERLVADINKSLSTKRKTVRELFAGIREETIGATNFRNRIERPGIRISNGDMDSLVRKYRVTGRSNEIDWDQFCTDVERSPERLE
jgi:Ca2+-binding EF-hand superfamily protein